MRSVLPVVELIPEDLGVVGKPRRLLQENSIDAENRTCVVVGSGVGTVLPKCCGLSLTLVHRDKIGAVAQLGERYNGIVEVRGSIPLSSTNLVFIH